MLLRAAPLAARAMHPRPCERPNAPGRRTCPSSSPGLLSALVGIMLVAYAHSLTDESFLCQVTVKINCERAGDLSVRMVLGMIPKENHRDAALSENSVRATRPRSRTDRRRRPLACPTLTTERALLPPRSFLHAFRALLLSNATRRKTTRQTFHQTRSKATHTRRLMQSR